MDNQMESTCCIEVEQMRDSIEHYMYAHLNKRHEWAQMFKDEFSALVDRIEKEMAELE